MVGKSPPRRHEGNANTVRRERTHRTQRWDSGIKGEIVDRFGLDLHYKLSICSCLWRRFGGCVVGISWVWVRPEQREFMDWKDGMDVMEKMEVMEQMDDTCVK